MRLSRLHINGFKSFPDRAELAFDQGVTAIVGPNGCGKSNVVDAITWVLGEQSAKSLRGERMEDIIFNGSDARKPTSAAEVRLKLTQVAQAAMRDVFPDPATLDPLLDEQPLITRDVEIGRRLYRSGESEYLIDGEICRLRDVHDLLMDSGLGIKAYAVIEQGKIGQILSSRPTERRALIEEAAGVTKYKSRRRTAELKLAAAQQNLTRVDDIVFEVEKQRGALKRQAARARRYKRLREELRRWEQVQFGRRYETLARDMAAADARLADASAREVAAAAHLAEREATLEGLRVRLAEADGASTAARERAHAHELEITRRQQQMQFDRQQISELGERRQALDVEARDLGARVEPARTAIAAQCHAAALARQTLEAAGARRDEADRAYQAALSTVQTVEREADELRAAVLGAATTLSALRQARENAGAVQDRVASERGRLDADARDLAVETERARADQAAATGALAGAQAALGVIARTRAGREATLAATREQCDQVQDDLARRQRELAGLEARLASLDELDAKRATFGDAARALLADAPQAIGLHGAVADHLEVERSYERAVDALLGDLLQHVLVDSAGQVESALAWLGDRDAGRCGFIVLEAVPSIPRGAGAAPPEGARSLQSVVRGTGPYGSAMTALIGDALIADSFAAARAMAARVHVPVAARTGEVCRGPWLIEGGARQNARGILETRGEVLALRERVSAGDAEIHRLANDAMALSLELGTIESEIAADVEAQHVEEKAIVGAELRVARAEEDLARLARRLSLITGELGRATEEAHAAEQRRDDAAAAIVTHDAQHHDAETRLGDVMARLHAVRDAAEATHTRVTDARTDHAALVERTSVFEADAQRLEETLHDVLDRLASRTAEIDRADRRVAELQAGIGEAERQIDAELLALDALRTEVRRLDSQVADLRGEFDVHEHTIRGARHALEAVRADVSQIEIARARAAADLDHLATACFEAVTLTLDAVVLEVERMERDGELTAPARRLAAASALDDDEGGDDEGLVSAAPADVVPQAIDENAPVVPEEVIADLRRKIERLGPVNMMAIEQFDELEARHLFLTTQRKDLIDAIAQTGEAIKRIDTTTTERFEEAFASINEKFQTTFTTLFGGGRAGLVLIDQEGDLESGVDIFAQPPGKRLQNVQLLSGGEKALTAMALMFAIFKHRPSPFCLLDEIDAPLDDANIGRFVEMLQGMQTHTQFILITHNRKTMEIADRLYGVTMEEPGVSKLISIQVN